MTIFSVRGLGPADVAAEVMEAIMAHGALEALPTAAGIAEYRRHSEGS
jgi:hypothetical protein